MKGFIIAGTKSGVGKTTFTAAIMKWFTLNGYSIAPFKTGPDYIDPKFHKFVTGNRSSNLDSFVLDKKTIKHIFYKNIKGHDLAVIEGVMGLYDGAGTGNMGSTAHIAGILGLPVILIIDGKSISRSIAAIIKGYKSFDKKIKISGVLLNRLSGEPHYKLLKKIIKKETNLECLGYLPDDKSFNLTSRHLGLIPVEELDDLDNKIKNITLTAEKTINFRKLTKFAGEALRGYSESGIPPQTFIWRHQHQLSNKRSVLGRGKIKNKDKIKDGLLDSYKGLRIGVAMDKAFNFYYKDNLDLMKECGMQLVEFSPLNDKKIPANLDGIYVGGGFPEEFAKELSQNKSMLEDINNKINKGMPVFAECGGLMYLTQGIILTNKEFYPLCGFFKCKTTMTKKLQRFGYVKIKYNGIKTKAHEFHHSTLTDIEDNDFLYKYKVTKYSNGKKWQCGLSKKNVLAGYPHVHFYSNLDFFKEIMNLFKKGKQI